VRLDTEDGRDVWKILFLIGTTSLSTACAFSTIPLTLPTKGLADTVPGGRGRQVVVSIPFSDARELRDRCGMQKNGYNMDTADAVCQSAPEAWIAHLLADELRASGFTVLRDESPHRPGALAVEGSLLEIFVEPVAGFWAVSLEADLEVRLNAKTETGLRAERTFFVKGWKGGVQVVTMQPFHTALNRATHALLEEMVRAIIELMDQYPELGLEGMPPLHLAALAEATR
jgi:hypothetical protein